VLSHKAEFYMRFVQLSTNGLFYATNREVLARPSVARRPKHSTDQLIVPRHAVQLSALWVCIRSPSQMHQSDAVARLWNPLHEMSPFIATTVALASASVLPPLQADENDLACRGVLDRISHVGANRAYAGVIDNLMPLGASSHSQSADLPRKVFDAVVVACKHIKQLDLHSATRSSVHSAYTERCDYHAPTSLQAHDAVGIQSVGTQHWLPEGFSSDLVPCHSSVSRNDNPWISLS
jgi:hypothetical protein